jgi:glycosidase
VLNVVNTKQYFNLACNRRLGAQVPWNIYMSFLFRRPLARLSLVSVTLGVLFACAPGSYYSTTVSPDAVTTEEAKTNGQEVELSPDDSVVTGLEETMPEMPGKPVVYQVFTRLFGNTKTTNIAWGTIAENGVGKFSDFTDTALKGIKQLGTTHIWYTGVPHHGVITDYTAYGISQDDPDVVKGRAGSPYAVKDYYSVDPDLADDPAQRLEEFEALIARTHKQGMRVIIDIVPNHVARNYHSISKPPGIADFGENDDSRVEYARDNNFYYVVGKDFKVPQATDGYRPLGGDRHPLVDGKFNESPAKWTGNGSRKAQPKSDDWYETIKINYGVKPDGSYDFPRLPAEYRHQDYAAHGAFWADKNVPDSWRKYRDIVLYWIAKGVDGFRYDVAELVPVEFWSYLNSSIKLADPDSFLLAEVYDPALYRDFIQLGKMDYLYDKVDTYDALKAIMQNKAPTETLAAIQTSLQDIDMHMLNFLENHDEQRIASPQFAGSAETGKPALVVSSLINRAASMVYFAQDVGEDGSEETGYGDPSRTTIFDYAGVPAHQRWMNQGKFDGGGLSKQQRALRKYYAKVLQLSAQEPAMAGQYANLHQANLDANSTYDQRIFSFVRWSEKQKLIVISNFDAKQAYEFDLHLPSAIVGKWQLSPGTHTIEDLLTEQPADLLVEDGQGHISVSLAPLQSMVFTLVE